MKFIDSSIIHVKAGDGGPGMVSFRATKNLPKQGADGGDGGFGGSVYLVGDHRLNTLSILRYKQWYKADSGAKGGSNDKTGRNGEDLEVHVPLGTVAINEETGAVVCEVLHDAERILICQGGKRGLGNARYLSSINQAPTQSSHGGLGEQMTLRLELKLLADVGLAGFPNAGKSTLVSVITKAKAKIADYPFTTLVPQLGVVEMDELLGGYGQSFVIADIPGLIEGAHLGKGLGHEFLKHLERTQLIVYLIDAAQMLEGEDLFEQWQKLLFELKSYSSLLASKKYIVVINKSDLFIDEQPDLMAQIQKFDAVQPGTMLISAATGDGLSEIKIKMFQILQESRAMAAAEQAEPKIAAHKRNHFRNPDLIVFGGTFDPPHRGHIDCIKAALRRYPTTKILVIPAFSPPLVEGAPLADGQTLKMPELSYEQRLDLVDQCLRYEFSGADVHLSNLESRLPVPSYTQETLRVLQTQHPHIRLALLVGEDQLEAFPRWKNPVEILKLADLLVVRRRHKLSESVQFRNIRQSIQTVMDALQIPAEWDATSYRVRFKEFDGLIDLLDVDAVPAESRMIRQYLKEGRKIPDGWLPSYIFETIEKNGYYR